MAPRPSHDTLIHCEACGEDYSATYRRCPFCGARNDPRRPGPAQEAPPPPSPDEPDLDDSYVFDGQDVFNDEPEEAYTPHPKGGKRLAPKQNGRGVDLPPINWPRLITFLCSLVIIVAALVIVFTWIYPQLHGDPKPVESTGVSQPPAPGSQDPGPAGSVEVTEPSAPVEPASQPPAEPSADPPPALTSLTLNKTDITLWVGRTGQLTATFAPSGWNGTVTWESSHPDICTVSSTGLVTNVNSTGQYHNVYITAKAGGLTAQCVVRAQSREEAPASQPPTSQPPASQPPASDPPATDPPAPSSGGTVAVGRSGTIVNAEGGLRVRSGPGTSYEVLDSLVNGNTVTVVSEAGNGWYQIQYTARGGTVKTGYIMGDYISTD